MSYHVKNGNHYLSPPIWSTDNETSLIELIRLSPHLWDKGSEGFKRHNRNWNDVAAQMAPEYPKADGDMFFNFLYCILFFVLFNFLPYCNFDMGRERLVRVKKA